MKTQQYIGRIASVPGNDGFAFIGIGSVTKSDGSDHDLDKTKDIFLHQEDCGSPIKVGMPVTFDLTEDFRRGPGFNRAVGAVEFVETEVLLPENEAPLPGFSALAPFGALKSTRELAIQPTEAQRLMKPVPEELVKQVLVNKPALTIPRDSSVPPNKDELMRLFLQHLFPAMGQFGSNFSLSGDDAEFERQVAEAKADQQALGMGDQIAVMEEEVKRFKEFRGSLDFMVRQNLVRRDTIIPIEYLPDFYTAVPVWFHWKNGNDALRAGKLWNEGDPQVNSTTKYFCNLFPNQRWSDFFQMFNRRLRILSQYKGDIIPPHVTRRIREAVKLFDEVVIMTPYLDIAGSDWQSLAWMRSIDPYVVGFKVGIPYFFILARFSDSGTFPLFTELVADTINFLKTNKEKLLGFNQANKPYWHLKHNKGEIDTRMITTGGEDSFFQENILGNHLVFVTEELLRQFEAGKLFDWLRGETPAPVAATK